MPKRTAVIIGAGPAGLTAAYELMTRTDIETTVLEMSDMVGGLARTIEYKGNLIDLGGHRVYSKDDSVMAWWQKLLPVQGADTVRDSQDGSVKIVGAWSLDGLQVHLTDVFELSLGAPPQARAGASGEGS